MDGRAFGNSKNVVGGMTALSKAGQQQQGTEPSCTAANMAETTDNLTLGVHDGAQALVARLVGLRSRLVGEPSCQGECGHTQPSINGRLVCTGGFIQDAHEIITHIAANLGYNV
jgi:hypothetical protein